jgi:hypothetical protein
MYNEYRVKIHRLMKLARQESVGFRLAIRLTTFFCNVKALFVYFLALSYEAILSQFSALKMGTVCFSETCKSTHHQNPAKRHGHFLLELPK